MLALTQRYVTGQGDICIIKHCIVIVPVTVSSITSKNRYGIRRFISNPLNIPPIYIRALNQYFMLGS